MEIERPSCLNANFFPNEVLIEIFLLLDYREIARFGKTSQRLLVLSESNFIWLKQIKASFEKSRWCVECFLL
jgi:hypothetical protein